MIKETEISKISNKQIEQYHMYLKYAMDEFIGKLITIKSSIKEAIIDELIKKHPSISRRDVEKSISEMVENKIKTNLKIEFEG